MHNIASGRVIFIGAGPGDPELITLKAIRHLNQADIILTDRLVNDAIIQLHAPQAVVIPVGKQSRKSTSTPQQTINELMVHHALAGRYVVRLKGGDVSVFSNITDELEALVQHNIQYEIVPGITAALGAAASLGVPLTARGLSTGIRLLTYYDETSISENEWENLAITTDTLVFYMSGQASRKLAEKLLSVGKNHQTPVLLVEQATTPLEIVTPSTLGDYLFLCHRHKFLSPSLLIIGAVSALHHRFGWQNYLQKAEEYFPELKNPAPRPKKTGKKLPLAYATKTN